MSVLRAGLDGELAPDDAGLDGRAPGKRTLTMGLRGGGAPLPGPIAAHMGRAFDADFSAVRVHEGAHVDALGARAYALGHEVHFAPGQFAPDSPAGRELIGHELAHVVQQGQGRVGPGPQAKGAAIHDDDTLEAEADHAGALAARGERVSLGMTRLSPLPSSGAAVQRKVWRMGVGEKARSSGTPALSDADAKTVREKAAALLVAVRAMSASERMHLDQLIESNDQAHEVPAYVGESLDTIARHVRDRVRPDPSAGGGGPANGGGQSAKDGSQAAAGGGQSAATRPPARSRIADANFDEEDDDEVESGYLRFSDAKSDVADDGAPTARIKSIIETLLTGEYVFNTPPLDSSGDIYHTLGFLAILREAKVPLPRVYVGYWAGEAPTGTTRKQAERAVQFAAALGFGEHVQAIAVVSAASKQANGALKSTRRAIAAETAAADAPQPRIFDQKVSTAVIAHVIQTLGSEWVHQAVEAQLGKYRNGATGAVRAASQTWQDAQLAAIRAAAGADKRVVLLNERIADSQPQHNTRGADFDAIRAEIDKPDSGLALYILRSHGDGPDAKDRAVSSPAFADVASTAAGFNAKVQHLQLLARIKEELGDRLVGIYGTTSGTLDVAALVGIRTLSMHTFSVDRALTKTKKKKKKKGLNEQDVRELIMTTFKSVMRRYGKPDRADAVAHFKAWLAGGHLVPAFAPKDFSGALDKLYTESDRHTPDGADEKDSGEDDDAASGEDDEEAAADGKRAAAPAVAPFPETQEQLAASFRASLEALLAPSRGGLSAALGKAKRADGGAVAGLAIGAATGVGMNCLIHTMVQLADGAAGAADQRVANIREIMIATMAAAGDEMLDPYQDGAGAALMEQFRAGGFATQILQWQGGQLLIHPVVGQGAVRLLLHTGNHFVPVWGNGGAALGATAAAAGNGSDDDDIPLMVKQQAKAGQLDDLVKQAIAQALARQASAPSMASSSSSSAGRRDDDSKSGGDGGGSAKDEKRAGGGGSGRGKDAKLDGKHSRRAPRRGGAVDRAAALMAMVIERSLRDAGSARDAKGSGADGKEKGEPPAAMASSASAVAPARPAMVVDDASATPARPNAVVVNPNAVANPNAAANPNAVANPNAAPALSAEQAADLLDLTQRTERMAKRGSAIAIGELIAELEASAAAYATNATMSAALAALIARLRAVKTIPTGADDWGDGTDDGGMPDA